MGNFTHIFLRQDIHTFKHKFLTKKEYKYYE